MSHKRYIAAGSLITGNGADILKKVFLAIENGTIAEIGPLEALSERGGIVLDDFTHCTILPALVDCSISLTRSPALRKRNNSFAPDDSSLQRSLFERHIRYCHSYGVLGIADNSSLDEIPVPLREQLIGELGIDLKSPAGSDSIEPSTSTEGPAEHSFLKFNYTADVDANQPQTQRADKSKLKRLIADNRSLTTIVVVNGREAIQDALETDCDAIEQGYGISESQLQEMAERNILWIPGIIRAKNRLDGSSGGGEVCCRFSQRYVAPGKAVPGAHEFWHKTLKEQLRLLRLARLSGVTTALGTGAGSSGILHGESMVEEMKLFMKAGYSLEETVKCASENGARFFNMAGLGKLEQGSKATFLITRGSVKQLPRKLSYPTGLYVNGSPSPLHMKAGSDTIRTLSSVELISRRQGDKSIPRS